MNVDENIFFREATMRICSTLDLEIAMWRTLQYISEFIPADEMYVHIYEPGLGALRTIAGATTEGGRKMNSITPLPEVVRRRILETPQMLTINRAEMEQGFKFMLDYYGRKDTSALMRLLDIEGEKLGMLALLVKGRNRFSDDQSRLFSLLKEPFSMALSNTMKHQEVIRLKDILADDNRYLHSELYRLSGDEIVGAAFGLKAVMEMVQHVAPLNSTVLLLGETGVGKDIIANAIHYASPRKDGPFIKVNCGTIPETLIDSELFGHEKGAFTGALFQKRGRFERADQGTIFLDEIGELPAPAQVKMLRVLQYKEIERLGGTQPLSLDIRLIAATNRNLEDMVKAKQFREDLWFRLNVFPIPIPPLRERKNDIPALVHYFMQRKSRELKLSSAPSLAPGSIDRLTAYPWPGNVRELENLIERAIIISRGKPLSFDQLMPGALGEVGEAPEAPSASQKLDDIAARHIRRILSQTRGRVHGKGGAADILGIHPSTLRNRMNQLRIPYGRKTDYS
jgi:transcriptional regulator with GAF, ATPase, and Fis domain